MFEDFGRSSSGGGCCWCRRASRSRGSWFRSRRYWGGIHCGRPQAMVAQFLQVCRRQMRRDWELKQSQ
ncbi:hypothetical protein PoB_000829300 [Plakobranchus ocellatus]|uniref:Uncharacterized protein n=1 Tax=Plakobranchus ocellatus TaxID=259542 RepID=A0AAV3YHY5_9GAST|nr:hypothetical protein PoB_000829300 [Plakobranchus ocellatus]